MLRRFVLAGFAGVLAVPAFATPASAKVAFSCQTVDLNVHLDPGLAHDPGRQEAPNSIIASDCTNGWTITGHSTPFASYVLGPPMTYKDRTLGCPEELGGAVGNNYEDQQLLMITRDYDSDFSGYVLEWEGGGSDTGFMKIKAGPTGTQWRFVIKTPLLSPAKLKVTAQMDPFTCPTQDIHFTNAGPLIAKDST